MSVFSTNQVDELIIGNAVASETTVDDFISSASDKEVKILSANGSAPASGDPFKVYQKTAGVSPLNFEFSDIIKPDKVKKVVVAPYKEEVQKSVRVTGFDSNVVANTTYAVEIYLYEEGGTLSPENYTTITGYHVTGANVTNETGETIRDGIVKSLQSNISRRGQGEFVITTPNDSETDIVITGGYQKAVPGKVIGHQVQFDVKGKQYDNTSISNENLGLLDIEVLQTNHPGHGTGKYIQNREYFLSGFKYDVTRSFGFPANFDTPYYSNPGGMYNSIHIQYFEDRESPTVERQNKVLTTVFEKAADDAASNAATNAFLADLRTILGDEKVPVDLAVA